MKEDKKIYIVYDWSEEYIAVVTRDKEKALAKIGEDVLSGENTDDYKLIEINEEDIK